MRKTVLPLLLSLCALALPARALPPPSAASYAWGAQLTVAGYDASKETLSDFPVLVRVSPETIDGFQYSQMLSSLTGADLCFIDMSGNGLPFEIDTWDPQGTSLVWVTLPAMLQGSQFVMCWGSATSGKTVCADNPFAGYKGVWHMDSVDPDDSSPNGFDGTHRTDNLYAVNGPVGTAVNVPRASTSDGITCGKVIPNPELTGGFTVEGWCRPTQYGGMGDGAAMFGKTQFISIRIASSSQVTVTTPGKSDHSLTGLALPAVNTWWHWAVTFKMNTRTDGLKLYVNGQCVKTTDAWDINDKTGTTEVFLGNNEWNQAFKGDLDEIRLSAGIQSADWIYATYAAQSDPAFLTAGSAMPYEATAEPMVGLAATDVQYTNATLAVTVGSLGMNAAMTSDASWVDTTLLVATDDAFANTVLAIPLARTNEVPASVSATAVPLVTNTVYWAKVVATNSFDVAAESSAVSFTTRAPGAPSGTVAFLSRGFTTLAATGAATDFGIGAQSATVRLEASADGFATVAASAVAPAVLGQSAPFTVPNLAPDTDYALRLRLVNDWGVATHVPLAGTYSTRRVPLAATGVAYAFSYDGSTVDVSFGVSEVFDGATCTATLSYNGRSYAGKSVSGPGILSWTGLPVPARPATATVTVTARIDGVDYEQAWTATVTPGVSTFLVSSLADHSSAATLLRVFEGDRIVLPELVGQASYENLNPRLIPAIEHAEGSWANAVAVTAEAGLAAIRVLDGAGAETARMGVLVMPRPDREGKPAVYVMKPSATAWCDAASWTMGDGSAAVDYPRGGAAAAMIPSWDDSKTVTFASPVSIGSAYFGFAGPSARTFTLNGSGGLVLVARSRKEGGLLRLSANTAESGTQCALSFSGGFPLSVAGSLGAEIDQGYALDEMDFSNRAYGNFRVNYGNCTVTIPDGASLRHSHGSGAGGTSLHFSNDANFAGAGELVLDTASHTWIWDAFKSFAGTIVVRNRKAPSAASAFDERDAFLYFRRGSKPLASMRLEGWYTGDDATSAGLAMVGCHHDYQTGADNDPHENVWPAKAWELHGGILRFRHENRKAFAGMYWTNACERLVFERGLTHIWMDQTDSDAYPTNSFRADAVVHEGKATFQWRNEKSFGNNPSSRTRVEMKGLDSFLEGVDGGDYTNGFHKVVPWMIVPWGGDAKQPKFPAVTPDGDVLAPKWRSWDNSRLATGGNYYDYYAPLNLSADVTINSLVLENPGKNGWNWYPSSFTSFGKGRTLTLAGGALAFRTEGCVLGDRTSWAGQDANKGVGTLRVPDTPLYVWAVAAASGPNEIWVDVDAPHGLVAAYYGHLRLGGVQTNIAEEITVNAGTLILGTEDGAVPTKIDVPVRVVGGGATLRIDASNSLCDGTPEAPRANKNIRLLLEDVNGPAKVCMNADDSVWECLVDGKTLSRGTWGSSVSGAMHVDDARFSGSKLLNVLHDDLIMPTMLILR